MKKIIILLTIFTFSCTSKLEQTGSYKFDDKYRYFYYTDEKVYEFQIPSKKLDSYKIDLKKVNIKKIIDSANGFMKRINFNDGKYDFLHVSLNPVSEHKKHFYFSVSFSKSYDFSTIKLDDDTSIEEEISIDNYFVVYVKPKGEIVPFLIHDRAEFEKREKEKNFSQPPYNKRTD